MPQHNGQPPTLGVELTPTQVILRLGGQRHALDPATSRQLALALTHWLLDQMAMGQPTSSLLTPPSR